MPIKPTPFPEGRAARISVNSFGIGGSNAHVSDFPSNNIDLHGYFSLIFIHSSESLTITRLY